MDVMKIYMDAYAKEHGIPCDLPFSYTDFLFDIRMQNDDFRKHVTVLQALENMRQQELYERRYDFKVIQKVMTFQHPVLEQITLKDMYLNLYDWDHNEVVITECDLIRRFKHTK